MDKIAKIKQNSEYTFKYNRSLGRHGWLRLTPAYSVRLVNEILNINNNTKALVFDPFSGTGTTGIVAAEHNYNAILYDINPFLVWFANQKARNYTKIEQKKIIEAFGIILKTSNDYIAKKNWVPDIFNINRWWDKRTLHILSAIRVSIVNIIGEHKCNEYGLIWIAFCRLIIETSSASFNHISMSFKEEPIEYERKYMFNLFSDIIKNILDSTKETIAGNITAMKNDSKLLKAINNIDLVITSPPYPNRISYIRELRPYMYWMKYIENPSDASSIDWESIGGTWGAATSRLLSWEPERSINFPVLKNTVKNIEKTGEKNSKLMSIYVHKYFYDMYLHINALYSILNKNAKIYYIVGNSTFFNVPVDSAVFFQKMLKENGFSNIKIEIIRKRNCKKELYEYCISAEKNGGTAHNSAALLPRTVYASPQ
jgi:DNA modification methylase